MRIESISAQIPSRKITNDDILASIPTAISMAHQQGLLNRGDRAILIPASAGMSFAVVQFTYEWSIPQEVAGVMPSPRNSRRQHASKDTRRCVWSAPPPRFSLWKWCR